MQRIFARPFPALLALFVVSCIAHSSAFAQSYQLTKLVSNVKGATHTDTQLVNGWGIADGPGIAFWVSDAGTGLSTIYDGTGAKQSPVVTIPSATGRGKGSPTGIVYNPSSQFQIDSWTSEFIFATLDGTISGWSHFSRNAALLAVNNSGTHTSYTGLAISNHTSGNNFIFAADYANNKVDVYDGSFNFVTSFTDKTVPAGFSVFGIQDIGGQVYVSYVAKNGGAGGYIDIFKENGVFVKRFAQGAPLNQPWGFAVAPANFGPLSNTLLIANNTPASTISGFNKTTGKLVGTMKDSTGKTIQIDQLWGIEFGGGTSSNGMKNQLFVAAGPKNFAQGLFGVINFK